MTKKADFSPTGESENTQVIDIIESDISPWGKTDAFSNSAEVLGAVMHQRRMNMLGESTLIVELSRVQAAFRGEGTLQLNTNAGTFREYVEGLGLNYKTITNKISHMKKLGYQLFQMFENLGVPVTLQRQIKQLPAKLRERLDAALIESKVQNAEEVDAIFRDLTAHTIALQDRLDEASTKTKVELIEERDQAIDHFELAEERMIKMSERVEKQQAKIKSLLASQSLDDKTVAIRKINDTLTVYFKALADADLSGDDIDLRSEKNRFLDLMSRAHEMGLS